LDAGEAFPFYGSCAREQRAGMPVTPKVGHRRQCRHFLVLTCARETKEMVLGADIRAFYFLVGYVTEGSKTMNETFGNSANPDQQYRSEKRIGRTVSWGYQPRLSHFTIL